MGGNMYNVVVRVVVSLFGIAAAVLAFVAEGAKIKASDVEMTRNGCNYPSTSANILGYIAAGLLLVAQVTISVVTRCVCCHKTTSNSQSQRAIVFVPFIISWVTSVAGFALLVIAATLSTRKDSVNATGGVCYTVKPGIFGAGGSLAAVASGLNLTGFRSSSKDNNPQPSSSNAPVPPQHGITMHEK